jgi:hypothetical protein
MEILSIEEVNPVNTDKNNTIGATIELKGTA